jgi:hypothetical protein
MGHTRFKNHKNHVKNSNLDNKTNSDTLHQQDQKILEQTSAQKYRVD